MVLIIPGCARPSDQPSSPPPTNTVAAPTETAIDPIVVRVDTVVAPSATRRVVEEVRIEPGINDISTFTDVREFIVDRAGSFWVYDDASNSISVFDSTSALLRKFGQTGGGPGELKFNGGMVALKDDRFAVLDATNGRITFFSSAGKYLSSQPFFEGAFRWRALVTDTSGALYVKRTLYDQPVGNAEPASREVLFRIGPNHRDVLHVPELGIRETSYMAEGDASGNTTLAFETVARYSQRKLWDWHPDGFFVTGNGALNHITLYRPGAPPLRIERQSAPVRVSSDERKQEEREILGDPTLPWRGPPLPEIKPYIMDLFVARDRTIWSRVPMPSEMSTEKNPDTRPGQPDRIAVYHTPVVWETFSSAGVFLARIEFPGRARVMQADGKHVWAIQTGDDDVPAVVRYRIEPR
jgi:hypothetical protein